MAVNWAESKAGKWAKRTVELMGDMMVEMWVVAKDVLRAVQWAEWTA